MNNMKNISGKTNDAIDLFKFIGSFLVVAIHTNVFISISETFNWYFINLFCRIAVYFFFVASAYFFFKKIQFEDSGKIKNCIGNWQILKKYVFRMILLYMIWTAIYLIPNILFWYRINCLTFANIKGYVISVFFNTSYYHLWFLISLIYAIPLLFCLLLVISKKNLLIVSSACYIVGLLFSTYCFVETPLNSIYQVLSTYWPRLCTVVFIVIPICSLALICDLTIIQKHVCLILAILFMIGYSAEGMILYFFVPNQASSYNLLLLPTVLFVFVSIKNLNITLYSSMYIRKTSTMIYCVHPLIILILRLWFAPNQMNSMLWFGLVSITTFGISLMIVILYDKFYFRKLQ